MRNPIMRSVAAALLVYRQRGGAKELAAEAAATVLWWSHIAHTRPLSPAHTRARPRGGAHAQRHRADPRTATSSLQMWRPSMKCVTALSSPTISLLREEQTGDESALRVAKRSQPLSR